ncbi:hypothetical protein NEHOM01_1216 [Nematocida homosporus]|uniref:uncharacterized protein n=1 Tax=Nematocida homosporus TaxID=1912981 RepID=UPI002220763C|nr:uncharacterized protein NEHOM01_1216 [Nematocida homosporus]KAI5186013.1 hypothetical protein NEHOM01_1216 [Nematocida homosporus]
MRRSNVFVIGFLLIPLITALTIRRETPIPGVDKLSLLSPMNQNWAMPLKYENRPKPISEKETSPNNNTPSAATPTEPIPNAPTSPTVTPIIPNQAPEISQTTTPVPIAAPITAPITNPVPAEQMPVPAPIPITSEEVKAVVDKEVPTTRTKSQTKTDSNTETEGAVQSEADPKIKTKGKLQVVSETLVAKDKEFVAIEENLNQDMQCFAFMVNPDKTLTAVPLTVEEVWEIVQEEEIQKRDQAQGARWLYLTGMFFRKTAIATVSIFLIGAFVNILHPLFAFGALDAFGTGYLIISPIVLALVAIGLVLMPFNQKWLKTLKGILLVFISLFGLFAFANTQPANLTASETLAQNFMLLFALSSILLIFSQAFTLKTNRQKVFPEDYRRSVHLWILGIAAGMCFLVLICALFDGAIGSTVLNSWFDNIITPGTLERGCLRTTVVLGFALATIFGHLIPLNGKKETLKDKLPTIHTIVNLSITILALALLGNYLKNYRTDIHFTSIYILIGSLIISIISIFFNFFTVFQSKRPRILPKPQPKSKLVSFLLHHQATILAALTLFAFAGIASTAILIMINNGTFSNANFNPSTIDPSKYSKDIFGRIYYFVANLRTPTPN